MNKYPSNCVDLVKWKSDLVNDLCRDLVNTLSKLNQEKMNCLLNELRILMSSLALKACSNYPEKIFSIESLLIDLDNIIENLTRDPSCICEFIRTIRRACRKKLFDYFELFKKLIDNTGETEHKL